MSFTEVDSRQLTVQRKSRFLSRVRGSSGIRSRGGWGDGKSRGPEIRRSALLLGFLLLASRPAAAAIAFGNAANNTANANSVAITLSPSAGSTVVVGAAIKTTTTTVSSVTDNGASGGSTYLQYVSRNDGTNERVEIWVALSAAASVTTITINIPSGSKITGVAAYYTGVSFIGNSADLLVSGATALTVRNEIAAANNWVVGVGSATGVGTFTQTTGNLRTSNATSGGSAASNVGGWLMDNTSASAPSEVDCTGTDSASNNQAGAGVELALTAPSGFNPVRGHLSQNWAATASAAETEYYQVGSGNLLVISIATNTASATVNAPTDSNGTVSTAIASIANGNLHLGQFYVPNTSTGKHQITVNFGASASNDVYIQEISGAATSSPLDVTASSTGTSSSPSSGSATTVNANDLLFGVTLAANRLSTPGSGYTLLRSQSPPGSMAEGAEYEVVSATGSYSAGGTLTASTAWIAFFSSWQKAVAASCAAGQNIALLGVGCR